MYTVKYNNSGNIFDNSKIKENLYTENCVIEFIKKLKSKGIYLIQVIETKHVSLYEWIKIDVTNKFI